MGTGWRCGICQHVSCVKCDTDWVPVEPVVVAKVPTLCVYKGRDDHPAYAISNACSAAHSRRYKCLHLACAGRVIVGTASLLLPCPEPVVPTTGKAPYSPFAPILQWREGGGSDSEQ